MCTFTHKHSGLFIFQLLPLGKDQPAWRGLSRCQWSTPTFAAVGEIGRLPPRKRCSRHNNLQTQIFPERKIIRYSAAGSHFQQGRTWQPITATDKTDSDIFRTILVGGLRQSNLLAKCRIVNVSPNGAALFLICTPRCSRHRPLNPSVTGFDNLTLNVPSSISFILRGAFSRWQGIWTT